MKKPATIVNTAKDDEQQTKTIQGISSMKSVVAKNNYLEEQLKHLEDQLKRALADYRNLERRVEEERKLLGQLSSAILVEKLLPVLDNLENAQKHLNDQGLEIVIKQFKEILKAEGVEEIQAEGARFDPNFHEATDVVEGSGEGRVVKVTQKGYKINNKVIRPTQVVVERKKVGQQVESRMYPNENTSNES
ncbi:nucleotide exchange factor GrpE [Candidatus Curtissbacteria bacterium RIFCSPHIGHO2_01_FULL_41_44]|uniref:Protein GrpE n=1 Tax=Candidatus Curtissbacteria bacterium RIFCSPLOWO2_01_FULL_42_50 TaxID=1797730 RepID=A0A1F5H458_9BACT|nr:MAG: nucleotide exchange factor GrpE [Candidatus Curtissbacteria bacterium RIFCSPHIGHO2_01_FULL_41_44]OGD98891.1 MAG: nucleotide exchange factor GrpE [Candidatus Curtissbacteria bacterium RIFCSPLOWO2_01_FULL_42_50]OGE03006.1 MAG: nucleotide exchange factor GrpE [Candidatus Curtissbacteria bacterium RIFCSPLOWO2_12_FULL_41_16]OGE11271.1 MAG: nucleotide exchange factor GrpE [Candidatus Curtissbacteria bacterium RIFCSPLOWO2_02_FULL_42_37]